MAGEKNKPPMDPEAYAKAIKKSLDLVGKYGDKLEGVEASLRGQKKWWDDISRSILGIDFGDFIDKIKIPTEIYKTWQEELLKTNEIVGDIASSINTGLKAGGEKAIGRLIESTHKLDSTNKEMAAGLRTALEKADLQGFMQKFGKEGKDAFEKLVNDDKGFKKLEKFLKTEEPKLLLENIEKQKELKAQIALQGQEYFSLAKGINKVGQNISAAFKPEKIKEAVLDFDKIIHETQRDTGIMFTENAGKMTLLTSNMARFGFSTAESAQFMGALGAELRTINYDSIEKVALSMSAIREAAGLSVEDLSYLGREFVLFGRAAEEIPEFVSNTLKLANKYGVSGKKIMQDIVKAMPKARELGWIGGAEALAKLATNAERLGQNMDEVLSAAGKLQDLDTAIMSGAELQLMGITNISPMQLFGAAVRGGKEFSDVLAQIGKGIGNFDEKTGKMSFNFIDAQRLKGIAEAVGMSVDSLQKQITKIAQDNAKTKLLPQGLLEGLEPEEQAFVLNAMDLTKKEIKIGAKVYGVDELSKITPGMIKSATENAKTIAEQAEQNMGFEKSVKALKDSIMNIFTFLEKPLSWLTWSLQQLTNVGLGMKIAMGVVMAAGALYFSATKQFGHGFLFGKGFNAATMESKGFLGGLKSIFTLGKGKAVATAVEEERGMGIFGKAGGATPETVKNTEGMGKALKSFPDPKQLLSLAVAIVAVGVAMIGIGYGIKLASEGLATLVLAFKDMTNAWAPLVAIAVVMGGFVVMLYAMTGAVTALGAAGTAGAIGLLAIGAAFLMIGAGIGIAAYGLSILVKSFGSLGDSLAKIGASGIITLYALAGGLLALTTAGALSFIGLAGLMITLGGLAIVMHSLAPPLSVAGAGMMSLAEGIERLKVSIKDLDTSKLKELKELSNAMTVGTVVGKIFGGGTEKKATAETIQFEPLEIKVSIPDFGIAKYEQRKLAALKVRQ